MASLARHGSAPEETCQDSGQQQHLKCHLFTQAAEATDLGLGFRVPGRCFMCRELEQGKSGFWGVAASVTLVCVGVALLGEFGSAVQLSTCVVPVSY